MNLQKEQPIKVGADDLLPGQAALLQATGKIITWVGQVRAGKGVGASNWILRKAIRNALEGKGNYKYGLGGQFVHSFVTANLDYLEEIANLSSLFIQRANVHGRPTLLLQMGSHRSTATNPGRNPVTLATFYLYGGSKSDSHKPLRGQSLTDIWLDEATLLHPEFLQTANERMNFDHSQLLLTSNADRPTNWIKKTWMDTGLAEQIEGGLRENIYIDESRKETLYKQALNPTAHQRQSLFNEWVAPEGQIYHLDEAYKDLEISNLRGDCFLDPGIAGITAALLVRPGKLNTYDGFSESSRQLLSPVLRREVIAEYYWNGHLRTRLDDITHIRNLYNDWDISRLFIDSAATHTIEAARSLGLDPIPTHKYPDSWEEGVKIVNERVQDGSLIISDTLQDIKLEAEAHVWDETGSYPKRSHDHLLDCLRYMALEFFPIHSGAAF